MALGFGNVSLNNSGHLSTGNIHHIIFVEFSAILGIIVAITGYRFVKLAMFLTGSTLGFAAFYVFSPSLIHTRYCCSNRDHRAHVAISLLFGVLIGILVSRLYRVGLYIIGKCFGLLIVLLMLQSPLGSYFDGITSIGSFLATTSVIVGSLTIKYEKAFVIASTSFFGTYLALCGADVFIKSPFSASVYSIIEYLKDIISYGLNSQDRKAPLPCFKAIAIWRSRNGIIVLVTWILLSFICSLIQLKITARDISNGGSICPFEVSLKTVREHCCGRKKEERETVYFYLDGQKWKEVVK